MHYCQIQWQQYLIFVIFLHRNMLCLNLSPRKKRVNRDKTNFQVQLINIERVFCFTNYQIDPHLRIGCSITLASVCSFLLCGGIRGRWRWLLSMNQIESLTIFATRSRPERGCYCSQNYDYAISFNIEPKKRFRCDNLQRP